MSYLMTVNGPMNVGGLGMILPHEHVFTDLRTQDAPDFGQAAIGDVVRVMYPPIAEAQAAGVTAIIECTPAGVGRNVCALQAVSKASGMPLVAAAGVYRQQYMPDWLLGLSEAELVAWLRRELNEGIDDTDIKGGFIKLAVSQDGITPAEVSVLRAAGRVGAALGVTVASHTIGGALALAEAEILMKQGLPGRRFVWVHTQTEPDLALHRELAGRGCYLEYDGIGANTDLEAYVNWIEAAWQGGYQERILLSQDAGWYRPGEAEGGQQTPYDFLPRVFLPLLRQRGFSAAQIHLLIEDNPKRAFLRE